MKVKSPSRVRPSATPWTAAYQAPLSMGFSRQEHWSGVPLPSPGGMHSTLLLLLALQKLGYLSFCIFCPELVQLHIHTIIFGLLELLCILLPEETFVKVPALHQRVPGLSLSQYSIYSLCLAFLLSIIFFRFSVLLYESVIFFFFWLNAMPGYGYTTICLSIHCDKRMYCFLVLTIMNKDSVNIMRSSLMS